MENQPDQEPENQNQSQESGPSADPQALVTTPTRMQSRDTPQSIREISLALRSGREKAKERERETVEKSGGHMEWLRRRAPGLLPLYPAGLTRDQFFAESLDGWEDAAERMKRCGRCPEEGGACADSQNAWPDGHMMVPDPEKGIRPEACPKWARFLTWRLLESANVPVPHRTLHSLTALPGYEAKIQPALAEARRAREQRWYFVTGGDARNHKHALIALAFELGVIYRKNFWYDWSARIAVGLREHMNDDASVDLRHKLRTVPVLAVDHMNPEKWKTKRSAQAEGASTYGWLADALDEVLYARSGKATLLASSRTPDELAEALPLTAPLLESAVQVVLE